MDQPTRLGLELLAAALSLGLLGGLLLQTGPGLGALLWIGALAAVSYGLARRWRSALAGSERWLLLPLCVLAFCYVWRDAPLLKLAAALALLVALAFGVQHLQQRRTRRSALFAREAGLLYTGLQALWEAPRFIAHGIDWPTVRAEGRRRKLVAVGRGLLLAVPVLAVFGGLLVSADALFEAFVTDALDVEWTRAPGFLLRAVGLGWLAGGFLYGTLRTLGAAQKKPGAPEPLADTPPWTLGGLEAGIVLGLVDALFAAFVLVQTRYLFGGASFVGSAESLTLAEYARRGFFELVVVVALALPVLLLLRRYADPDGPAQERCFRWLASAQVALLLVLLVSAGTRMVLYTQTFGLTELRLYTSAFMGWLALVLGWFAWTVLRDRTRRFVPGTALAGFAVVLGLYASNPDALIVRTNVARATAAHPLDARYLAADLSADAVPALLEALPLLSPADRATVARLLLQRWHHAALADWRALNRAHLAARRQVKEQGEQLEKFSAAARQPAARAVANSYLPLRASQRTTNRNSPTDVSASLRCHGARARHVPHAEAQEALELALRPGLVPDLRRVLDGLAALGEPLKVDAHRVLEEHAERAPFAFDEIFIRAALRAGLLVQAEMAGSCFPKSAKGVVHDRKRGRPFCLYTV